MSENIETARRRGRSVCLVLLRVGGCRGQSHNYNIDKEVPQKEQPTTTTMAMEEEVEVEEEASQVREARITRRD